MRVAVLQFPGSNADFDALQALRHGLQVQAQLVFHKQSLLGDVDAVVVPGGFSYGDYLRPGAIARFSPIAADVQRFAERGGPVLGICNGFQILCEMGLLPGVLTRNRQLRFVCRDVKLRVEGRGWLNHTLPVGTRLRLPIAHADGRYTCDAATLRQLQDEGRIALRYEADNPNGSLFDIAGVYNAQRNVLGMMPHPERASEAVLGNVDGLGVLQALRAHVRGEA